MVEDRDTILELTGKIQELQNEINCMNDSRDFQDAESVRSGQSHVASQPVSFPPHPVPGGMPSRSLGMPSRKEGPPSIWDTSGGWTLYRRRKIQIQRRSLNNSFAVQPPVKNNYVRDELTNQNRNSISLVIYVPHW